MLAGRDGSCDGGACRTSFRAMAARLNVTLAVKRLIRDAAARLPELAHVRASRVLVVAGEARRSSRATLWPAHGSSRTVGSGRARPAVRVKGREILYVITLRPLWFRDSTAEERVRTVLHELYHASTRFDGTLHRGRRHEQLPQSAYARRIDGLTQRYLAAAPHEILAPFSHRGLVRARMWLERPSSYRAIVPANRRTYTERQLYYGIVRMLGRRTAH
ncbi:MAG: putative metallopeptidase [Anaeromyxobacteraceae bacterium]